MTKENRRQADKVMHIYKWIALEIVLDNFELLRMRRTDILDDFYSLGLYSTWSYFHSSTDNM